MLRLLLRCAFITLCAIALLAAPRSPADAATQVLGARVDVQPDGSAIVVVQFGGPPPHYTVAGSGSTDVTLIFSDATIGPSVPPAIAGSGPVTSMALSASGGKLALVLHLVSPANIQVRASGASIAIDVPKSNAFSDAQHALLAPPATGSTLGIDTEIVNLRYADVSEIAGVLVQGSNVASNDTFEPISTNIGTGSIGGSLGGFGGTTGGGIAPQNFGATGFGQQTGLAQRLNDNIAIDRRLNAIILTGPPALVAQLKEVIEKIDVPVKSVILECEIVELSDTASKAIGVDFSPLGQLASGSYTIKNLTTGQGSLGLSANIYAQVIKGQGKILAKPRILAQSGTSASILTGDAIPILTAVVVTGSSALTSNQVNYINVGVSLQIQPRVSDDGFVTSHIYSEVSSVTGESQGYPQISQRQATTAATVKDGESFVIGGLLQDDEIRSFTKLPFVGDLPIIGSLFGYTTTSRTQSNLYIVITPHIVGNYSRPPAQTIEVPVDAAPPSAPAIPGSTPASGPPIVPAPVNR